MRAFAHELFGTDGRFRIFNDNRPRANFPRDTYERGGLGGSPAAPTAGLLLSVSQVASSKTPVSQSCLFDPSGSDPQIAPTRQGRKLPRLSEQRAFRRAEDFLCRGPCRVACRQTPVAFVIGGGHEGRQPGNWRACHSEKRYVVPSGNISGAPHVHLLDVVATGPIDWLYLVDTRQHRVGHNVPPSMRCHISSRRGVLSPFIAPCEKGGGFGAYFGG